MSILNAATVGCGRMGAFHSLSIETHAPPFWMPISHLGAINSLDEVVAVACCDLSKDQLTRAQEKFDVPHGYDDYKELLENHSIDLLTIATRTPQKAQIILDALTAGVRAIHVEKPLCNTAAELAQLEQAILDSGAWVTYGCLRPLLPPYRQALAHSQTPEFGPLVDIHVEMGKEPLMWSMVHALNLLVFFADRAKPVQVQAWFDYLEINPAHPHTVLNDPKFHSATVLFETGLTGRIGHAGGHAVTLSSEAARIEVFANGLNMFASVVPDGGVYQERHPIEISPSTSPGGTAAALSLLQRALHGDAVAQTLAYDTTQDMLRTQHLIFDMVQSHLNGGTVVASQSYADNTAVMGFTDGRPA